MNNYYIPNTLDGINQIQSHVSDNALLVDGSNLMEADLDVGGHNIKNLEGGIAIDEAVNVAQLNTKADLTYVNTQDNLRVLKAGDTMTGALAMSNNKITGLLAGTTGNDAVNYTQLSAKADTSYVNSQDNLRVLKSGDSMTGSLSMTNNKITNLADGSNVTDAVNYQQLSLKAPTTYVDAQDALKVSKAGDSMTGNLSMTFNKITNLNNGATGNDAVNFTQLSAKADTTYVNTQDALRVLKTGDTMTGALAMTNNKITGLLAGTTGNDAVNYTQLSAKADTTYVNTQDSLRVLKTGDTMTGALAMTNNKITNLLAGTGGNDAVNYTQFSAKADTTYVNSLDAQNVKLTGIQSIAGSKTFNDGITLNSASPQLTISNGGANAFTWTQGIGGTVTQTATGNMIFNSIAGSTIIQSNSATKLTVASTVITASTALNMSSQRITGLGNPVATTDAVNVFYVTNTLAPYALDASVLHRTLDETKTAGILTFNVSPVVPLATLGTQAANLNNISNAINALPTYERYRMQAPSVATGALVSGVNVSQNKVGVGWTMNMHDSPQATASSGYASSTWNRGVMVATKMVLYAGDTIAGFFTVCDAANDGGATIRISVYDDTFGTWSLVDSTQVTTIGTLDCTRYPFTTPWTVSSTRVYYIVIIVQNETGGGDVNFLTCSSRWQGAIDAFYSKTSIFYNGNTNQAPPASLDAFSWSVNGAVPIIYAYK